MFRRKSNNTKSPLIIVFFMESFFAIFLSIVCVQIMSRLDSDIAFVSRLFCNLLFVTWFMYIKYNISVEPEGKPPNMTHEKRRKINSFIWYSSTGSSAKTIQSDIELTSWLFFVPLKKTFFFFKLSYWILKKESFRICFFPLRLLYWVDACITQQTESIIPWLSYKFKYI